MGQLDVVGIVIVILFFFICLHNEKNGFLVLLFSLSFVVPFNEGLFPFGLSGAFIIILSLKRLFSYRLANKTISLLKFSNKFYALYYILIIGIILGIINIVTDNDFSDTKRSAAEQLFDFSGYIVIVILFVKLLLTYRYDYKFQQKMMIAFSVSIIFHFLAYFKFKSGMVSSRLFYYSDFDTQESGIDILRYVSFIGDYELTIDYTLIVIFFSLIIFNRTKNRWIFTLIPLAVWVAVTTGTRSFFVVSMFAFLLFIFFKGKKFILYTLGVLLVLVVTISSIDINKYASANPLFARMSVTLELLNENSGHAKNITNRDFSKASLDLVEGSNILGNGSFWFTKYNNNEMVSHNLFLAIYAKYGLPGILIILSFFVFMFRKLVYVMRNSSSILINNDAKIFFIALASLILQELKISAVRNLGVILIYAFLFFNIYCLYLKNKYSLFLKKNKTGL